MTPAFCSFREANVPTPVIFWHVIDRLASTDAVLAADAFGQVDHHVPLMMGGGDALMGGGANTLDFGR